MVLNPGKLRHRVVLEYPIVVENDYGEEEKQWERLAERYARVSPMSGTEEWNAQNVDAVLTHEVEIRYMEDVRTDLRVCFRGRVLHVESVVNPDERDERLLLMCREVQDKEPN